MNSHRRLILENHQSPGDTMVQTAGKEGATLSGLGDCWCGGPRVGPRCRPTLGSGAQSRWDWGRGSGGWRGARRRERRKVAPFQGFGVMVWSSWGVAPGYHILPLWDRMMVSGLRWGVASGYHILPLWDKSSMAGREGACWESASAEPRDPGACREGG